MGDFDARFMKDEELHDLLERWRAPDASRSLDNRVAAAYNTLMGDAAERRNSALHPQRDSEVVKMKFCNTCQEQFADRFSFCPVDGTPLGVAPAPTVSASASDIETSYPIAESTVPEPIASEPAYAAIPSVVPASAAASSAGMIGDYHLTILEDRGLLYRLAGELGGVAHDYQLTWPEFKRDPFGFVKRSVLGYGQMIGGFFGTRNVMIALSLAIVAIAAMVGAIFLLDRSQSKGSSRGTVIAIALVGFCGLLALFATWLGRDRGSSGMAKGNGGGSKPKQEKAGGGGGGGRQEKTDASNGKLPQADLKIPQVVAPDPHPPVIKNPVLPMPATLDADPVLFPPDTRQLAYGDPKSKSTTPSSGSGTGNGIGDGRGGGVGPGTGSGYGPGNGGNTGGGDRREGGGGPGGGGGGTDYNRVFSGKDVTSKARVLEKPEPQYTENARKNQITGTVVIRAVFSASGQVTNISAISKLPDGLTEKAIAAARQIRFIPATKDGRPVSMYMQLEYNFNLY